jgi:WD40 repeat protein/transcriptional regulator with XRE-family HTH domain
VIPTPQGLKKLQEAILALEKEDAFEYRLTQERIGEQSGLAIRTIRKVLNREGLVSISTLQTLFSAFNLELVPSDYAKPKHQPEASIGEPIAPTIQNRVDWGEAIDVSVFHGRETELTTLRGWIVQDRCRLLLLLGMGGIGKTALSVKLAQQLEGDFEVIIWRSLRNAPPFSVLVGELVESLSDHQEKDGDLRLLISYLRSLRCLIVLDNLETLLQPQGTAGRYRQGYEDYGTLLQSVAEIGHSSCLVLTSREKPAEIAALEGSEFGVRSLLVRGSPIAAQALLSASGLVGTDRQRQTLADEYGNSPLAIKIIANSIKDLFDGDIAAFLAQDTTVFNNIRYLLAQQFERLSPLEQTISYWLAIDRDWTSMATLIEDITPPVTKKELLSALESLSWRSFLERQGTHYTQQPVVMEYVTERLLEKAIAELSQTDFRLLRSHTLFKAQASDTIRSIQQQLLMIPAIQELLNHFGGTDRVQEHLIELLQGLRQAEEMNYLAGNLLNLLCDLNTDLSHLDLGDLTIWQADFREINLQGVNFSRSNLAKSVFSQAFGTVYAIAFSPNNQQLATGHADGTIRVWQVNTGQLLVNLKGHQSSVWTLAFSPTGDTLASGSFDRTIKLWNLSTETESRTLSGHQDWVTAIAFSPDGQLLASCSNDRTLKIWQSRTGKIIQTFAGHTAAVTAIAFHPQNNYLVSGSEDLTLRFWQIGTGECLKILEGHTTAISSVAFSFDGEVLASSEEQLIELWSVETGECIQTIGDLTFVWSVAFSPDGELLAGSDGQTLRLWEVQTGQCCQILSGYTSQVWSVAFSPNGQLLAASDNEQVGLWDVQTGERLRCWQGYTASVESYWSLAFDPTGERLVSGDGEGKVRVWDLTAGNGEKTFSLGKKTVHAVCFSPDGRKIAGGGEDNRIGLWDSDRNLVTQTFSGHTETVWTLAFSQDGQILASGSADRTIKLWDLATGNGLKNLAGHEDRILSLNFSPDRQWLISGSADHTLKLWDIKTGRCLQTFAGHQGWVWCVAFSPDGRTIASGGGDRTVKLWDTRSGDPLATLSDHTKLVWSVSFSRDGQKLFSGSADRTAKLWDIATLQSQHTFSGQTDFMWVFHYASDGQILVSGSQGDTIQVWNFLTGECLKTLRRPKLYEGMKLADVSGLTPATLFNLQALGGKI